MCVRVSVMCEFLRTTVDYAVKLYFLEWVVPTELLLLSVIFCFIQETQLF